MPIFAFEPDVAGLTETLEFKTSVQTAYPGNEQRSRSRTAPRSIVEVTLTQPDGERAYLNSTLYGNVLGTGQMPNWWEAKRLSQNLSAGTRSIQCAIGVGESWWADFQVGGYGVLFSAYGDTEIFPIGAMSSVHLQIPSTSPGLSKTWLQQGTWVMPLKTAFLASEQPQSMRMMGMSETKLKYTVTDNTDLRGTAAAAFPTYLGKPLMNRVNAAANSMQMGWMNEAQVFDPGNRLAQVVNWTRPKLTQDLRIVCKTQQAIWETRLFFHELGGRQRSFWMGTGKNDMPPLSGIGLLQGYLSTAHQNFVANYGATPAAPRGHLQLVRTDGVKSQHAISSAAVVSSSREDIGISPGSPMDLSDITRIARVEFLTLCRLREDTVKITYTGLGRAVFEASIIGVSA